MYKYETHMHTSEGSACGAVDGAAQARYFKEMGYTGIIITDHFFNGNCTIDRNLPWEKKVMLFCLGYEHAKEEGDKIGLDVFFGWEAGYNGTEFLIYGLDKEWLLANKDVDKLTVQEQYHAVKSGGGLVIHAHPFRQRSYIKEIRLFPECVDGVEAINKSNGNEDFNLRAIEYAKQYDFIMTEGSDAHGPMKHLGGMQFDHRLQSISDYINTLKTKKGYKLLSQQSSEIH